MDNSSYPCRCCDKHTNNNQSYNSEMGGVVSAIARGLVRNIERDFVKQISPSRDKPKDKVARKQEENSAKKTRKEEPASLSDLSIISEPVKHGITVNKHRKNKEKKDQSSINTVGEVSASLYPGQTEITKDAEDFFQDFLPSLETTCLIQEHECGGNENISGGSEDTIFTDYEDSFLPIINLLSRLTEDLAAQQRRPNPAWFKKSYTNTSTVQKIYLPKPKCTPIRR